MRFCSSLIKKNEWLSIWFTGGHRCLHWNWRVSTTRLDNLKSLLSDRTITAHFFWSDSCPDHHIRCTILEETYQLFISSILFSIYWWIIQGERWSSKRVQFSNHFSMFRITQVMILGLNLMAFIRMAGSQLLRQRILMLERSSRFVLLIRI